MLRGLVSSGNQSSDTSSSSQLPFSFFTLRRFGFTLAGTCLLAGAAAAAAAGSTSTPHTSQYDIRATSTPSGASSPSDDTSAAGENAQNTDGGAASHNVTSFSVSSDGSTVPQTRLNVNGQEIPIPNNGNSSQTVQNTNGSQTTVDVSGNTSTQGDGQNYSSSTFSVNVQSESVSEGGTTDD